MASNPKFTDLEANTAADAATALLNTGYIRLYTGTQPATADTALGVNTLLVELRFNATAFGAASAGTSTANAIVSGTAVATGTATFFRVFKSDGTTAVFDGSVGTASADMVLGSTAIQSGGVVSLTSGTYAQSKG